MFDLPLIKHMLKYELKWSYSRLGVIMLLEVLLLVAFHLLFEDPDSDKILVFLILVIVSVVASSSSSLLPRRGTNQGSINNFSWKYLHSTIVNRKGFVIAYAVVGVLLSLPCLFIGIVFSLIVAGIDLLPAFVILFPIYLLFVFQMKVFEFLLTIEAPRRVLFRFKDNSVFIRFFRRWVILLHMTINKALFLGGFFIFYIITIKIHLSFALITFALFLMVTIKFSTDYIYLVWQNENQTHWSIKRELKNTAIRLFFVLILSSLFSHFSDHTCSWYLP